MRYVSYLLDDPSLLLNVTSLRWFATFRFGDDGESLSKYCLKSGSTHSHLSRLVRLAERSGFVERVAFSESRKEGRVVLSEKGEKFRESARVLFLLVHDAKKSVGGASVVDEKKKKKKEVM